MNRTLNAILKRWFDIVASTGAAIILFPILSVVAIAVKVILGSPVLYAQKRPGRNGSPFTIYKFRTMTDIRDANGDLLPDAQRLTSFGRFLRATSLDELPELINIIKGDMSVVGPRPLLIQYLKRYTPKQARRHEVRPGLTGWAQVNGRNAISWEEKFNLDVWYVDNQTFLLDLKIIAMTVKKTFCREDISHNGEATMSEYMGPQEK